MKDSKIVQEKIAARYNHTFEWAMTATKEELDNILEGKQKYINIFKNEELVFSTGVSNTDKDAIRSALKLRK